MTGMPCSHARECQFYKVIYDGVGPSEPVLNPYGERTSCDALTKYQARLLRGPPNLTEATLRVLRDNPLECTVLEGLNRKQT